MTTPESSSQPTPTTSASTSAAGLPTVSALRAGVEAILLVVDAPVTPMDIARALETDPEAVRTVLHEIRAEFTARGSGFDLRELSDGWRLYTQPEHADAVERFLLDGTHTKLSRAALETLAVVAYRQPVTRAQVSAVRGVNCDGVMRTLLARGLVAEAGEEPATGAHLYITTELLLEQLGIDSLEALPDLAPLLPDVDLIDEP
ncbi:SMC-Scp complex subunit ScpB [Corynebacterium sp. TAE3-ERU12]|uniref:SMC-Scp complex subunit ScpB n=1 Tax=Corynebacterium sp. TAE3-ERU12 TaxID=2849491 RepID=UPI001C493D26|nr:SMC-Scp complex subunit ScpB [Corynebacterium sp. TAE3-ERU12]MBV7295519.1 SMC-Scp complex subunit ScpB [Corynebacterium sp. TAE3-ERU12]